MHVDPWCAPQQMERRGTDVSRNPVVDTHKGDAEVCQIAGLPVHATTSLLHRVASQA